MVTEDRGRFLGAVAQIRRIDDEVEGLPVPWASLPLWEGQVELAVTWIRNNHATLVEALKGE